MQLQSVFIAIAMVAFAVTGAYAGDNSANACFYTCGEKPDCSGRVLFPQKDNCWSCCTDYSSAS